MEVFVTQQADAAPHPAAWRWWLGRNGGCAAARIRPAASGTGPRRNGRQRRVLVLEPAAALPKHEQKVVLVVREKAPESMHFLDIGRQVARRAIRVPPFDVTGADD